ncbi:MAG: transglycosylase SLT domain-containing protein [Nitrospirae bacterium]|nr:transglycosylase SLT domain-containing protein [Nitrospirota bacterium]
MQSPGNGNGEDVALLAHADPVSDQNDDEADDGEDASPEETKNGNAVPPIEESLLDTALVLTETSQELWAAGEAEKAVEALDHAYELILKAPTDAEGKNTQQKDDLRFVISKRLMEIYTSRLTSVNGLHKEIPLVLNEHVEREIKLFQTVERDFFLESYKRSGRYRDEMVKAFHEAGLPEEITWLPLIESGFKVRALSRARALGLWQFIPSTGYKFGLKRTSWVDERLDPSKSTAAAIAYLKELHQVFGDWATVLAAYNCGEGNVFRVIRQQRINYLDNFWDLYQRLPRETARYYPRFLAVLTILKDPAKFGFTLDELDKRIPYEVVAIEKPLQLSKISDKIGCSPDDLADLNAELRYAATPNTVYDLKVPFGMKDALLANIDTLPKWSPPQSTFVVHRVRRGETLSTIAIRYRTSIQKIMEANNLRRGKLLRIGQKLKIPTRTVS